MNQQLAVIHPGTLTPSDGNRRTLQRALGKADRRLLTDAIHEFAGYADSTGASSTHPTPPWRTAT